jgi:deoxyribose-phosphate aldolase
LNNSNIDYVKMEVGLSLAEAQDACVYAKVKGFRSVCLPQWLIAPCSGYITGSNTKLATIVGLPGGRGSTSAKYAEVKAAVMGGATSVIVPMNMDLIADGKYEDAGLDFARSVTPAGGADCKVTALIEILDLSADRLTEAVKAAEAAGTDEVCLSSVMGGGGLDTGLLAVVGNAGIPVSVLGGTFGNDAAFIEAGAVAVGASKNICME